MRLRNHAANQKDDRIKEEAFVKCIHSSALFFPLICLLFTVISFSPKLRKKYNNREYKNAPVSLVRRSKFLLVFSYHILLLCCFLQFILVVYTISTIYAWYFCELHVQVTWCIVKLSMWQTLQKVENDTTLHFFSFKKFFLKPSQKRDFSRNIRPKRKNTINSVQVELQLSNLTAAIWTYCNYDCHLMVRKQIWKVVGVMLVIRFLLNQGSLSFSKSSFSDQ